ncbi:DNA double-strand break repair nuclease NurA [Staphylothermus hellenicus]|uniref:NurA domain protein n=1 Tax=Staphylothermus hellenicus (strain DSM 12710 / JCM 10830 / BK20S6-10-b1 / P8) TaxID=591019 RepID=D7D9C9_STAHD|nr:DNA double-strand break repair nuclease NurA [Staphylothermus hellenicus]ADI32375.1 NurA domain protein [Staphylothermus hellenicus DSM 12710]
MGLLSDLIDKIRRVAENNIDTYARDDDSRIHRLYDYFEYVSEDVKTTRKPEIIITDLGEASPSKRFTNIYALDSSSRVVDTPYLFIAIGSVSAINRFNGFIIDHPEPSQLIRSPPTGTGKFLAIVPEIMSVMDEIRRSIEEIAYTYNPAGTPYTPSYNKFAILDELRIRLENYMLKQLCSRNIDNSIVFLDGPIYYVPPNITDIDKNSVEYQYFLAWKILVKERIRLVEKIISKNNVVMGIVKRLYRTNLLSRIDPLEIAGNARINDEAYLSLAVNNVVKNNAKLFVLGPIKYSFYNARLNLVFPVKKIYYLGIPKRTIYGYSGFREYAFYRFEILNSSERILADNNISPLDPVLYDSVVAGSILPLSILIVDQRVKKITSAIANNLIREISQSGETTLRYISI